jgi:pyruvate/oxaloacetate carboxyltransferase
MASTVIFNNTVLRDGHQSLAATRMSTAQMLPALPLLDDLGFGALETWGGATIDAGLRFLGEFPFDRLDALKRGTPKTKHMMLLRGQNIVQYANFPDDVVQSFVDCSARHGMDIFRVFDALNDLRNIRAAVEAVIKAGKHAQGVICYTSSPVHTIDSFIQMGRDIEAMGCHSICVKDMAGLIPPPIASAIIRGIKASVKIPVNLHTHETAGLGGATYYAGIEAGVDMVDTSIVPFANGTGQPDTIRMLSLLQDHPRCPRFDTHKLQALRTHFEQVYKELSAFTSHQNEVVDSDALEYQVPGGMLSNFRNQLKEQKMEDRFEEVFAEIPVVRKALGWIPLVTPTSQIVGVQAMLNVKFGRWQNFAPQAIDIALGYYGQTPAKVDPEVRAIAAKKSGKDPIDCRPADLIAPRMPKLKEELRAAGLPDDDEHAVIHAMFPQELKKYYDARKAAAAPKPAAPVEVKPAAAAPTPAPTPVAASPSHNPSPIGKRNLVIHVGGQSFPVEVEEIAEQ